jgi:hypothetical protein
MYVSCTPLLNTDDGGYIAIWLASVAPPYCLGAVGHDVLPAVQLLVVITPGIGLGCKQLVGGFTTAEADIWICSLLGPV